MSRTSKLTWQRGFPTPAPQKYQSRHGKKGFTIPHIENVEDEVPREFGTLKSRNRRGKEGFPTPAHRKCRKQHSEEVSPPPHIENIEIDMARRENPSRHIGFDVFDMTRWVSPPDHVKNLEINMGWENPTPQ